jgi:hypothetical protein
MDAGGVHTANADAVTDEENDVLRSGLRLRRGAEPSERQ